MLYDHQPYPDNYSPVDWLSAMSSYSSAPAESEYLPYRAVVWLTLIIANRASILTLFITTFYAINQHRLSTRSLLLLDVTVAVLLLFIHYSLSTSLASSSFPSSSSTSPSSSSLAPSSSSLPPSSPPLSLFSACLLCVLLLLVSPLLSTLTWSYSSDTIYLLVLLLSAAHLLSFDYSNINSPTLQPTLLGDSSTSLPYHDPGTSDKPASSSSDSDSSSSSSAVSLAASSGLSLAPLHHPVSLNCALLLSLLLASRLSSPLHVSLLLLLSSLLFAASPSQQQLLCCWSATAHLASFVLLSLMCFTALCLYCSALLAAVYALCVLGVCLVCPWWLLRVQRYKRTIHGPWDYNDEPENSAENL